MNKYLLLWILSTSIFAECTGMDTERNSCNARTGWEFNEQRCTCLEEVISNELKNLYKECEDTTELVDEKICFRRNSFIISECYDDTFEGNSSQPDNSQESKDRIQIQKVAFTKCKNAQLDKFKKCDKIDEKNPEDTAAAKMACMDKNFGYGEENIYDTLRWVSVGLNSSSIAFLAMNVFLTRNSSKACSHYSLLVLTLAGILGLGGELGIYYSYKGETDKINKSLEGLEASADIQYQAFSSLKEEVLATKKALKSKVPVYASYVALSSLGFILAVIEGTRGGIGRHMSVSKCKTAKKIRKETNTFIKEIGRSLDRYSWRTKLPWFRAVMAGLMIANGSVLLEGAIRQQKTVDERERILTTILASVSNFEAEGIICKTRKDPSNLQCYCYIRDDAGNLVQNPQRSNSEKCKKLWAKNSNNGLDAPPPTNYGGTPTDLNSTGCVSLDLSFDRHCDCKKTIDIQGKNNCYKIESQGGLTGSTNTTKLFDQLIASGNNITNSNPPLANLGVTGLGKFAARNLKNAKKFIDSPQSSKSFAQIKEPALLAKEIRQIQPALISQNNKKILEKTGIPNMAAQMNLKFPKKVQDQIDKTFKKFKESNFSYGAKKKSAPKKSSKSNRTSALPMSSEKKVEDFEEEEEEDIDIKNHDFDHRSRLSLFKLISVRYQKSAYHKLFKEE